MDEFREEPSKYVWRWTTWSWVCVGLAVMIALMGVTSYMSPTPWIIGATAEAVIGGIGFGFVPRASLNQPRRAMTPGARRKAAARAKAAEKGDREGGEK